MWTTILTSQTNNSNDAHSNMGGVGPKEQKFSWSVVHLSLSYMDLPWFFGEILKSKKLAISGHREWECLQLCGFFQLVWHDQATKFLCKPDERIHSTFFSILDPIFHEMEQFLLIFIWCFTYQESKASVNFARMFLTFSQIQDSAELLWTRANGGGVEVVVFIQEEKYQNFSGFVCSRSERGESGSWIGMRSHSQSRSDPDHWSWWGGAWSKNPQKSSHVQDYWFNLGTTDELVDQKNPQRWLYY